MYRLIFATLILSTLWGCEEYFQPDIDNVPSSYMFEGIITDQNGPQRVKITKSQSFNNQNNFEKVTGATLTIEDKNGTVYPLTENSPGFYITDSDIKGSVYHEYRLRAVMADGKEYISDYDMLQPSARIDSIIGEYYQTKIMRDGGDGIFYEETIDGIRIKNNTDSRGYTPFYRYTCDFVYQSEQYYVTDTAMPFSRYIFRPANSYGNIFVGNGNLYAHKNIQGNPLFFADRSSLFIEYPFIFEGLEFNLTSNAWMVQLNQYSLTEKAYNFWNAIVEQQKASNYLFDPIESQIEGNMHCVSDSTELVFGFFGASAVVKRCEAFTLRSNYNVRTVNLESIPKIDSLTILDTVPPYLVHFN
jgi:hypothetical protein